MAISTTGTYLTIKGEGLSKDIKVYIKSFPDLGAAPAAIEVTTLADEAQVFIPGKRAWQPWNSWQTMTRQSLLT